MDFYECIQIVQIVKQKTESNKIKRIKERKQTAGEWSKSTHALTENLLIKRINNRPRKIEKIL